MAVVTAKVTGGQATSHNASTVSDLKSKLGLQGYTPAVNGEPATDSQALVDGDFVTFSQAIKGGC